MYPVLARLRLPWGTVVFYSYGVLLGLSILLAYYIVSYFAIRKDRFSEALVNRTYIVAALSGLLGARLTYVFTNLNQFSSPLQWFSLKTSGMVAYGAFIGGAIGSMVYLRLKRASIPAWGDAVAPTLALGLMVGRIGCYLYGCDFGAPLSRSAPSWLRSLGTFPRWPSAGGSPAWKHHVARYGLPKSAAYSLPVHPTQLYESLTAAVLLVTVLWVFRHRAFRGQVLMTFIAGYGVCRFFLERLRDDPGRNGAFGLSTSQWISLTLLPVAVVFYAVLRSRARRDAALLS